MIFFYILLLCAASIYGADGQAEGDKCVTNGGAAGICMNSKNCASAQQDIDKKIEPKICKFVGEDVIVCCDSPTPPTADKKQELNAEKPAVPTDPFPGVVSHTFDKTVNDSLNLAGDAVMWGKIGKDAVFGGLNTGPVFG